MKLRPDVLTGAKLATPSAPTMAPRRWPWEPVISTCASPDAPGGRLNVTRLITRGYPHLIVSFGCGSAGLAIQVVAASPSKAFFGWSCGSPV